MRSEARKQANINLTYKLYECLVLYRKKEIMHCAVICLNVLMFQDEDEARVSFYLTALYCVLLSMRELE